MYGLVNNFPDPGYSHLSPILFDLGFAWDSLGLCLFIRPLDTTSGKSFDSPSELASSAPVLPPRTSRNSKFYLILKRSPWDLFKRITMLKNDNSEIIQLPKAINFVLSTMLDLANLTKVKRKPLSRLLQSRKPSLTM